MSGDNIDNEQITKVPEPVRNITKEKVNKLKNKDPKKVAAGKKLAQEMKREANPEDKWLPESPFSTVLTVVGIGLTAADLFFRFYRSKTPVTPVATTTATAITTATPAPQQKACVSPRIGMV